MATGNLIFVENDTLPNIVGVYKDADGTPVNIAGYTIKLRIGYATVKEIAATLTDAASGEFTFYWTTGDLVEGTWLAEVEITDDTGKILTAQRLTAGERLKLVVRPEI
jgi:nitrogen fixation protein FixH